MNKNILAAAVTAVLSLSAIAQSSTQSTSQAFTDKVAYSCQSGKNIEVTYRFNEQGLPDMATANIDGQDRQIPVNLSSTDEVSTIFGEENKYMISGDAIDSSNYKQSSILVFSPSSEILYKGCSASNTSANTQSNNAANQNDTGLKTVREETVHYTCQSNREIDVSYGFNEQGLPTKATVKVDGKVQVMPINLHLSDATGQVFGGENEYMLGTGALDVNNYKQSSMMLTAPNNEILYKNCSIK